MRAGQHSTHRGRRQSRRHTRTRTIAGQRRASGASTAAIRRSDGVCNTMPPPSHAAMSAHAMHVHTCVYNEFIDMASWDASVRFHAGHVLMEIEVHVAPAFWALWEIEGG